jgi:UDP-N-acetyl-D-glucosamine dehydrogenase
MVPRQLRRGIISPMSTSDLHEQIRSRSARVGVVGCGYVGLPLSQAFADAGFSVVGIDVDARRVDALNRGVSHILDVPADILQKNIKAGRFTATTDFAATRDLDVIFISVPTPFDKAKQPDLSFVISAARGIAPHLHTDQLIVLESTTFPGTTDEVLRPILEEGGLVAGRDFYLAFSPERIDPGNKKYKINNTPKVVGGVDPESTKLAVFVLEQIITAGGVHAVSSARAAELSKLLENTFRAVNIALVNELAMLCDRMAIDLWEVIDAAATKPYGFVPFYPGPGVGGHCIPVDPYYLAWKAREYDFHTKFIELAAETNLEMPLFTATRIQRLLNEHGHSSKNANILVLGATFKPNIDDARNSAAIRVMEVLRSEGACIEYHDPFVSQISLADRLYDADPRTTFESVELTPERLAKADCVAILVAHSSLDYDAVLRHATLVFDAVNATGGRAGKATAERL